MTLRVLASPAGDISTPMMPQAASFCAALICSSLSPGLAMPPMPK
jgi:hypothetical protein